MTLSSLMQRFLSEAELSAEEARELRGLINAAEAPQPVTRLARVEANADGEVTAVTVDGPGAGNWTWWIDALHAGSGFALDIAVSGATWTVEGKSGILAAIESAESLALANNEASVGGSATGRIVCGSGPIGIDGQNTAHSGGSLVLLRMVFLPR